MTEFTKEIEGKIRDLGLALKLQLEFAAAADLTKRENQIQLGQNNMKAGLLMIDLVKTLGVKMTDDAGLLEDIAAFAEKNGSDAGKVLKEQAVKVRRINADAAAVMAKNQKLTPEDMNRIFRKHLAP